MMKKIYFGPWGGDEEGLGYFIRCWFRPVLKLEEDSWEPEVYFRFSDGYNHMGDSHTMYKTLQECQDICDQFILKFYYGSGRGEVIFISQEQFDKLKILV